MPFTISFDYWRSIYHMKWTRCATAAAAAKWFTFRRIHYVNRFINYKMLFNRNISLLYWIFWLRFEMSFYRNGNIYHLMGSQQVSTNTIKNQLLSWENYCKSVAFCYCHFYVHPLSCRRYLSVQPSDSFSCEIEFVTQKDRDTDRTWNWFEIEGGATLLATSNRLCELNASEQKNNWKSDTLTI